MHITRGEEGRNEEKGKEEGGGGREGEWGVVGEKREGVEWIQDALYCPIKDESFLHCPTASEPLEPPKVCCYCYFCCFCFCF